VAFLRRNRTDSEAILPPDGIAMTIQDVFWIGPPPDAKLDPVKSVIARKAPGTVLLGELRGSGLLRPGDLVVCEQGRFPILAIEAFKQLLDHAEPPRNVGLRLGTGVDRSLFAAGQQVHFARSA
jgi:hypothetical protein